MTKRGVKVEENTSEEKGRRGGGEEEEEEEEKEEWWNLTKRIKTENRFGYKFYITLYIVIISVNNAK